MMETTRILQTGALALTLLASGVMAAVSDQEAAQLGASLTPLGAEMAGNADGSIPAWTGGLPTTAAAVDGKGFLADPFADELPLFTITAANAEQYKDKLSAGQLTIRCPLQQIPHPLHANRIALFSTTTFSTGGAPLPKMASDPWHKARSKTNLRS